MPKNTNNNDLGAIFNFPKGNNKNKSEKDLLWDAQQAEADAKRKTTEVNRNKGGGLVSTAVTATTGVPPIVWKIGVGFVGVSALTGLTLAYLARQRKKKVELEALRLYSADYAVQFAKAFQNFGGISEIVYDAFDEVLPSFLSDWIIGKDSDWENVKSIANNMAVHNVESNDGVTPYMPKWFKQYTKKDFFEVAKKVLESNQYDELLTIMQKKVGDFKNEDVVATQDTSYFFNSDNVIKFDLAVGQIATQHDLKDKIVLLNTDATIYSKIDDKKTRLEPSDDVLRSTASKYMWRKGAFLGVTTGRKIRPDTSWVVDSLDNNYYVELLQYFVYGGKTYKTTFWVYYRSVVFTDSIAKAKIYTTNGDFTNEIKNYNNSRLTFFRKTGGDLLSGLSLSSLGQLAKLYANNGTFQAKSNGKTSRFTFLEGDLVDNENLYTITTANGTWNIDKSQVRVLYYGN